MSAEETLAALALGPEESRRLATLQTELDQCRDLLRQRRALREFGGDPSQARARR